MSEADELRKYVIGVLKKGIVHPNPLTPSEIKVLELCVEWLRSRLQPAQISDEQIKKWANNLCYNTDENPNNDTSIIKLRYLSLIEGAKAYRDGQIAEWVKQNKE